MNLEPNLFVILGATGDLYRRKLLPALHALVEEADADVRVLGAATSALDDERFREQSREALEVAGIDATVAGRWCEERLHYHQLGSDGGYEDLRRRVEELDERHGLHGNRVFYLALPPRIFPYAITELGAAGLNRSSGSTRLVIEKPFGRDRASAASLNDVLHQSFDESQVYRIDHYLGKETVQNLLVFRFANPLFEASWNRDRVARVEITVAESVDVGTRGAYYDHAGVVRDMVQNHLTQVLSLVAMETPISLEADAVRDEKVKVLRSIQPVAAEQLVLGQYDGYSEVDAVADRSMTPTYAAVRLGVDSWRWQGVPFLLRTGKAMERRTTQVAVTFRQPPICLFHGSPDDCMSHSDILYLTLQPDEGFSLEIEVKEPGESDHLRTIPLRFSYSDAFGDIPDSYITLLRDVIEGDQTLFVRADEVDEAWRIYDDVLDAEVSPHPYEPGSWGPEAARTLLDPTAVDWATGGE